MKRRNFVTSMLTALLGSALPGSARSGSQLAADSSQEPRSPARSGARRTLIRNGYVITLDPQLGDIPGGDVLIEGDKILSVGKNLPVAGANVLQASGKIVMPGLINCHQHTWGSILRSFYSTAPNEYQRYNYRVFAPHFRAQDIRTSVLLGAAEMIFSGVTTLVDTANNCQTPAHADANFQALKESGIRAVAAYRTAAQTDYQDVPRILREHFGRNHDQAAFWLDLQGPEHVAREVYLREWKFARDHGIPIQTNIQYPEPKPIRKLQADGLMGPDVKLIHPLHADEDELKMIRDSGSPVTSTPISEMLWARTPLLVEFLRGGIPVSLGVDVMGVSDNADMFAVMRMAVASQRARLKDVQCIGTRQVLEMVCKNGALFAGWPEKIGSLTPGKYADLILVRTTELNMTPMNDPVAQIVYAAQPFNVDVVMVGGQILKQGGRLVRLDVGKLVEDAQRAVDGIRKRAGATLPRA